MALPQNHLIELLPAADRKRLLAQCETVQLSEGQILCEHGQTLQHAYFPVDGFVSMLAQIDQHPSLEVGMVGREGLFGGWLLMGVATSPLQGWVQGSGSSWRIGAAALQTELTSSQPLRQLLLRYLYVLMAQTTRSAACLRFHMIAPRLARWLLMTQDRAHASDFKATHEQLASVLGVRRVSVTVAASQLQRSGLIQYHRGQLSVLDRTGLEAAACSCYRRQCSAYQAQMGLEGRPAVAAHQLRPSAA